MKTALIVALLILCLALAGLALWQNQQNAKLRQDLTVANSNMKTVVDEWTKAVRSLEICNKWAEICTSMDRSGAFSQKAPATP